jgi:outer membrane protein assembly factor BamB
MLYVGSRDKHLYALKANSGETVWRVNLHSEIDAAVAIPGEGRLITADDSGLVRMFEEKE